MFQQAFDSIDSTLRGEAGCGTELDYIEQTSWIIFLKYLDDFEKDKEMSAKLNGQTYQSILDPAFKWSDWAAPKTSDGKIDYKVANTGDDLKKFVDEKLFPYLKNFKYEAESPDTLQYKIGEIFSELKNKFQDGYNLRAVIDIVDGLRFRSNEEKHEMSSLYEDKIKRMGNAGRNGGEYYTPRPLIKTIVKVINPKIGDKVYDGAVGSAGFLCEAYEYLKGSKTLTVAEYEQLQKKTLYGKEKKSLAYIIGVMNMILHGIEAPNILHTDTLSENIFDIQEKDKVDVILANPPFGSGAGVGKFKNNFPIQSSEMAYLFMQHFIRMLKAGGRCGVVIKNTFLSNGDASQLRKLLLEECNLYAVLDLPKGAFTGTGVATVVLFFEKGKPTNKIWYYQLNLDRNLGKTNSLSESDLQEFVDLVAKQGESENSWVLDISDINKDTWDLSVVNPNRKEEVDCRTPQQILKEIEALDAEAADAIAAIKELL